MTTWDWNKVIAHDHKHEYEETPVSSGSSGEKANKYHPEKKVLRKRQKAARKVNQKRG